MRLSPRPVVIAALAIASGGCSTMHSLFPSHEEVFKPIAMNLGTTRVVAGDTTYVLEGRGFEVRSRDRSLLPDAKKSFEEAAYQYRRFFGADPARVVVALELVGRRGSRDTTNGRGIADGAIVAPVYRATRSQRGEDGEARAFVGTRSVAKAWLNAYRDSLSTRAGAATAASGFPAWYEEAALSLLAPTPVNELLVGRLADDDTQLLPLRTLLTMARPAGGPPDNGTAPAPTRDGAPPPIGGIPVRNGRGSVPKLEGYTLFASESYSVGQYIADREGAAFIGQIAERLASGGTFESALAGARTVPTTLEAFESGWRGWLANHRARR